MVSGADPCVQETDFVLLEMELAVHKLNLVVLREIVLLVLENFLVNVISLRYHYTYPSVSTNKSTV